MLNSVATPQSSKISNTNYTQQITANGNELTISWEPYANGLSGHQDDFCLKFQNGILEYYWDFLGINTVGSSNIQISEAQAIQIATERAHNFTYTQDNQIVSNFTILNSLVITNASLENRGNSTLCSFWHVMLPLDKMYPGGVTMFDVGIWADTGEIAYFTPIGFYGEPGPIPTENATSTQNPTPTEATQPAFNILIFGLPVTAATVIIAVGYLLYKRKR
jgi:hypothetical protein